MNRNKKEKTVRIELRIKPREKAQIRAASEKCGLSITEYVRQRALGYEPKAMPEERFFKFYSELCRLCNLMDGQYSEDTEYAALNLLNRIRREILMPGKEAPNWQPLDSGQSNPI